MVQVGNNIQLQAALLLPGDSTWVREAKQAYVHRNLTVQHLAGFLDVMLFAEGAELSRKLPIEDPRRRAFFDNDHGRMKRTHDDGEPDGGAIEQLVPSTPDRVFCE